MHKVCSQSLPLCLLTTPTHKPSVKPALLVAACDQFSGITVVYRAAGDIANGCGVRWDLGYLGSMYGCGAAQWRKLSESWPNSNSPTATYIT